MFNPGETVGHRFIIPFVAANIAEVIVSYKQGGDIVFEKSITSGFEEVTTTRTEFTITFSQEESLVFKDKIDYTIQLNVLTRMGSRATSREIPGKNGIQYYREVMLNERVQP